MTHYEPDKQGLNKLTAPTTFTKSAAWTDNVMPPEYAKWRRAEQDMLLQYIQYGDYVADYCCGDGRLIHVIMNKAARWEGCDNDADAIERARTQATRFEDRVNFFYGDFKSFCPENELRHPDISICLGNSLAPLEYSLEERHLPIWRKIRRERYSPR
jgi:hypothetical protein